MNGRRGGLGLMNVQRNIILAFLLFTIFLYSKTTGKIVGWVYDVSTGFPLPSVEVIVEDTHIKALTDSKGFFSILNIPPGEYQLSAVLPEYRAMRIEGIIVEPDLTRSVEFYLKPVPFETEQVSVKAKPPLIRDDVTASLSLRDRQEIETIPANDLNELIGRGIGFLNDGGLFHIRGGGSKDFVCLLNGTKIEEPYRGSFNSGIPVIAIKHLLFYTGGYDVEYGEALSGVCNIITEEGVSDYNFNFNLTSNDALGWNRVQSFLDKNYSSDTTFINTTVSDTVVVAETLTVKQWQPEKMKRMEFSVRGPLVGKKLNFAFAGEYHSQVGHHPNFNGTGQSYLGSINFNPSDVLKIKLQGLYNVKDSMVYLPSWKFNLEGLPHVRKSNYMYSFKVNHKLSSNIVHKLSFSKFTSSQKYNIFEDGSYDLNSDGRIDEKDRDGVDDFADEDYDLKVEINGEEESFGWDELSNYPFERATNFEDFYIDGYHWLTWEAIESSVYNGNWDIIAQIGKCNEVGMGLSLDYYDIFEYQVELINDDIRDGSWVDETPYLLSVYLNEKLEKESFVLSAGLRFDYFNPNSNNKPADVSYPVPESLVNQGGIIKDPVKSNSKYSVSPRIGFSFPVSDYCKFRFNYGHYSRIPPLRYLYFNSKYNLSGENSVVGNPDLEPEEAVSYEMGLKYALNPSLLFDFTIFIESIDGTVVTREVLFNNGNDFYNTFSNAGCSYAKGIEFILLGGREDNPVGLKWDVKYSLSLVKGNYSSEPDDDFFYINHIKTGEQHFLDWDRRHSLKSSFLFYSGRDKGFWGMDWLRNSGINFIIDFGSGLPWTAPQNGLSEVEINGERLPYNMTVDVRFYKRWILGKVEFSLIGDIYNLFNRRNIQARYFRGNEEAYIHSDNPAGVFNDPRVYSGSRYMRLGLSVKW